MRRLLALMLVFAATAPLANAQTEPRLAGGPERICSESEIRQALAGSYAGPPCRFTEMPSGLDMALQSAAPQPSAYAQPARYEAAVPPGRPAEPEIRSSTVSRGHEVRSLAASEQHADWWSEPQAGPVPSHPAASPGGETVRLGDDFFNGGLVGGVERPVVPLYSYRGMILIAADGQVRTASSGLDHRILQVRALDNRQLAAPNTAPLRAYPYR
jgi:hypothetical protein